MIIQLSKVLWAYRGFISGSVKRDFQARYQNSMLGATWNVLNPLAMITIYTLVFSRVMQAKLPGTDSVFAYSIYLCAGIITWQLFAEIVGSSTNVFLNAANLIKKLNFPRICLPFIVVLNATINFGIIFTIFLVFLALTGNLPGWPLIAVIPILLIQILFSIGLGIIVGVLNVFFRDVGQFMGIALQFWFWLTPIVYPSSLLPEQIRNLIYYTNPMAPIIGAYQTILSAKSWPDPGTLIIPTLLAALLCFLGIHLFSARADELVDEL
jgi:lipopolysaccharide transport system permease protein